MLAITPRPANPPEKAVLRKALAIEFNGVQELREQIDLCEVTAQWSPESVSVELRVPVGSPKSAVAPGPIPTRTSVSNASGELEGEILVWTEGGFLSALEYAWYGDEMPTILPEPERMRNEAE